MGDITSYMVISGIIKVGLDIVHWEFIKLDCFIYSSLSSMDNHNSCDH